MLTSPIKAFWLAVCLACCAAGATVFAQEDATLSVETGEFQGEEYYTEDYYDEGYPTVQSIGSPTVECGDETCGAEMYSGGFETHHDFWQSCWEKYRFKHSSRDGRWTGRGHPLRGTSWLNRPYEFSLETGGFLMANRISANNSRNNDVLIAANLGWDWDHYWGTQFRVAWTTPQLSSTVPSSRPPSTNVLLYDLSLMYYPWGDSRVRPYYRFGLGLTDIDFINPAGRREDATLLSMPLGIGIKYQTKRWFALRAEAVDYITWGQNSASNMQNFTLTFGLEWRFGGRPNNNWTSPSRAHSW